MKRGEKKASPDGQRSDVVIPQGFSHDLVRVKRDLQNFGIVVFFGVLTFRKSDHLFVKKSVTLTFQMKTYSPKGI